jgi:deazaflavin-dependent oxidoreductase (nitroreductase family)
MAVKVPRRGTRGVPFPKFPAWLARFYHRRQARGFREHHGGRTQGGIPTLLLETVGAKTGERRSAMVGFIDEASGSWLIIASLAGSSPNPAWLYNLARDPHATLEFGDGRRVEVTAQTLDGEDLDAAWRLIAERAPEYPKYKSKTDRPMPVVRLRLASADAGSADRP